MGISNKVHNVFLEWRSIGGKILAAQDPLYSDARWIIHHINLGTVDYKLIYVRDGEKSTVDYSNSVNYLRWLAVIRCLNILNDIVYKNCTLFKNKHGNTDEYNRAKKILEDWSDTTIE